jgi:hypothetical protein
LQDKINNDLKDMYPEEMVKPMQAELTTAGFKIYIVLKPKTQ